MTILATNKKAGFDYEILEKFEAGLALAGYEVKSAKLGHMSLKGSYVVVKGDEAYLLNAHISPYQPKNMPLDYDPTRSRRLLLHKSEISRLVGEQSQKGLTFIPLSVYTNTIGKIKLSFALAKGKKKFDKRAAIAEQESKRRIQRAMRARI